MAHCDSRMSDNVGMVAPAVAVRVAIDRDSPGARGGLGCVSNGTLVACTGAGDQAARPGLVVYDADGRRVWDDGGLLGPTSWLSAAMISSLGQVIAADQQWLVRVDPLTSTTMWVAAKPDLGTPISPVPVGLQQDMVLLATKTSTAGGTAELSVWDMHTGAMLSHKVLVHPVTGASYETLNTPSVRGARAYVLASAIGNSNDGQLFAVDVCESAACGGRGSFQVAWHVGFDGPSSASPLRSGDRIFFDGLQGWRGGLYLAVDDLGDAGAIAWQRSFSGRFGASSAHDPRGGLWVAPWQKGRLLRLNEATGATEQLVDVSAVLGEAPGYSQVTAVSVSSTAAGSVVLTFGAQSATDAFAPPYVAAIDVGAAPGGVLHWKNQVSPRPKFNAATGQMPIVINASGARRVVFKGTRSSTYFVGEP